MEPTGVQLLCGGAAESGRPCSSAVKYGESVAKVSQVHVDEREVRDYLHVMQTISTRPSDMKMTAHVQAMPAERPRKCGFDMPPWKGEHTMELKTPPRPPPAGCGVELSEMRAELEKSWPPTRARYTPQHRCRRQKKDRATLNKVRAQLDTARKELRAYFLAPTTNLRPRERAAGPCSRGCRGY